MVYFGGDLLPVLQYALLSSHWQQKMPPKDYSGLSAKKRRPGDVSGNSTKRSESAEQAEFAPHENS
jgi:hypothetical protein